MDIHYHLINTLHFHKQHNYAVQQSGITASDYRRALCLFIYLQLGPIRRRCEVWAGPDRTASLAPPPLTSLDIQSSFDAATDVWRARMSYRTSAHVCTCALNINAPPQTPAPPQSAPVLHLTAPTLQSAWRLQNQTSFNLKLRLTSTGSRTRTRAWLWFWFWIQLFSDYILLPLNSCWTRLLHIKTE